MSNNTCNLAPNEHEQHRILMNECVIVYTGVILCCSCSLGAVSHVLFLMNECVIVYTGVILCCSCSLGAVSHVLLLMNECVIVYTGISTNNIEWHLYRQLHTRAWVKTHVPRLLLSTNNIEWHLYRQLHTRSWVTTHVTWLLTSTNNIEYMCFYSWMSM
jgi:hypothetical protein